MFKEQRNPAIIYLFKVNNGNTRITCETQNDVIDVVQATFLLI